MKVSEAKNKICPFTFGLPRQEIQTQAGPIYIGGETKCICGGCMAWEYIITHKSQHEDEKEGYCKRIHHDWFTKQTNPELPARRK